MPNEADTCRRYVVPKLQAAGWENEPHSINEQVTFTDGRIVRRGRQGRRRPAKRADYLLRYTPRLPHRRRRGQGRTTRPPATGCSRPRITPRSWA